MGLGNGGSAPGGLFSDSMATMDLPLDTEFIINLVFFVKALPMEDKLKNLMIGLGKVIHGKSCVPSTCKK